MDDAYEIKDIRCRECNKLLGKCSGAYEIMCPRCKAINADNIWIDIVSAKVMTPAELLNTKKESVEDGSKNR